MSINIHVKSGQNKWDVSIDATETIATLKDRISTISEIPAPNQRLIYSGKILKDDQTIESYNIHDDHSIHLVKSGGAPMNSNTSSAATTTGNTTSTPAAVPSNIASGQSNGFNPLADLTSARYAGYGLNMPSADMFGPDGGMTNAPNQDDMLRMLDNPVFQSQMNEMLSNPQMLDFMIQSNPQLQAMGPQARQILQSPMFRQMLTNPDMIRQSMQFSNLVGDGNNPMGAGAGGAESFPAPGETGADIVPQERQTQQTPAAATAPAAGNPFAALFNPSANQLGGGANGINGAPAFDPAFFSSLLQDSAPAQPAQEDTRPPEERYESQLRQLNDMGFFDFDKNVVALRRSGGSVQGALDALLNGDL